MPLHLSRVAFGATGFADLVSRIAARAQNGEVRLTTRFLPKRHSEIVDGGSLYWIIRHQLVARAAIKRFEATAEGRTDIVLDATVIAVFPQPRRAHQGWRYLDETDAPADMAGSEHEGSDTLPDHLLRELAELALV